MSQLANALFTKTQQWVLGLLYTRPDRSYYTKEILRATGMGVATIKRELDRMVAAGILTLRRQGNQHYYQANADCPIYQELLSIVRRTFGIVDVLGQMLKPLADRIDWGFVFGSVASGKESANSDIGLVLVGDLGFDEAVAVLHPAQDLLSREINPKVYSKNEWSQLRKKNDASIREVMFKPRLDVIGKLDEPEDSNQN